MYISQITKSVYSGDRAHWRDIPATSEPPSPHHRALIENSIHVGWDVPPGALDNIKADAVSVINAAYQDELSAVLSDYPEVETKTWDKQEAEARAYTADSAASTPLIDSIADARGMDKSELVSRIIAKADAWIVMSGQATGKRQALEDAINAATTFAEVDAVEW